MRVWFETTHSSSFSSFLIEFPAILLPPNTTAGGEYRSYHGSSGGYLLLLGTYLQLSYHASTNESTAFGFGFDSAAVVGISFVLV
jgi:hypothetical protein